MVVGLGLVWWSTRADAARKTVRLSYQLDRDVADAFRGLAGSFTALSGCAGLWRTDAEGRSHDRKYHAGATSLVDRKAISIGRGAPPYVETNIEVHSLPARGQTLYFFPDRVLVYQGGGVGVIPYRDLRVAVGTTRFIENGRVPLDAEIVDYTWKYVNKDGGPDRRFANNPKIPVLRLGALTLTTETGLRVEITCSQATAPEQLAKGLAAMRTLETSGAIPKAARPGSDRPPEGAHRSQGREPPFH